MGLLARFWLCWSKSHSSSLPARHLSALPELGLSAAQPWIRLWEPFGRVQLSLVSCLQIIPMGTRKAGSLPDTQ